ncbi:DUF6315 family protein [Allonocardiopsis opalescens]|uniref:Uncharacterized protein n=1 Tax=Allonocardiopsis opalescens TaxID=1144618 RepID=A0A2T0Q0U6_9ACTN|nr:DUF6315 family protein [Allonocardiopsis opalescens]PRX97411.1 hypothetical protein CLV72_106450 [Allonocardiopsis opalescens]
MTQTLTALCCQCGNTRAVSTHRHVGEAQSAYGFARCVVWRKCAVCGEQTTHAYLRDDPERDELEDALNLDDALAAEALDEEVDQLRQCGVEVGHAPVPAVWDGQPVGMLTRRLDDHAYAIVLDPGSSVVARLKLIDLLWNELMTGGAEGHWYIQPGEGRRPGYAVRLFGYRVPR